MVLPGLLAIIVPVLVGFGGKWFGIGGAEMLGGLLAYKVLLVAFLWPYSSLTLVVLGTMLRK